MSAQLITGARLKENVNMKFHTLESLVRENMNVATAKKRRSRVLNIRLGTARPSLLLKDDSLARDRSWVILSQVGHPNPQLKEAVHHLHHLRPLAQHHQ